MAFTWAQEVTEWGWDALDLSDDTATVQAAADRVAALLDELIADDVPGVQAAGSYWSAQVRGTPDASAADVYSWAFESLAVTPAVPAEAIRTSETRFKGYMPSLDDVPPYGRTAHRQGWTVRRLGRTFASVLVAEGNPDDSARARALAVAVVAESYRRDHEDRPPGDVAPLAGFARTVSTLATSAGCPWTAGFASRVADLISATDPASPAEIWRGYGARVGRSLSFGVPGALFALLAVAVGVRAARG